MVLPDKQSEPFKGTCHASGYDRIGKFLPRDVYKCHTKAAAVFISAQNGPVKTVSLPHPALEQVSLNSTFKVPLAYRKYHRCRSTASLVRFHPHNLNRKDQK